MVTQEQFRRKCQLHNFFFEYSDSFENSGFNRGWEARREILAHIRKQPKLQEIYDQYNPFNSDHGV